jgi:hypothetical protein
VKSCMTNLLYTTGYQSPALAHGAPIVRPEARV